MATINGQEITKTVNNWFVDGRVAYLGRDGITLVAASGECLATLAAAEVAMLTQADDADRAARIAGRQRFASRETRERSFDRLYNEGGEGYNPHRYGSAKTYR